MDMISDDDTDIDLDWQSYLETYHLLGEELAKGKEKQQVNTLLSLFFEFLMIVLLDEESDDDEPAARTFTPRTRACFWETTASMTDKEFSQCFRFTRKTFKSLLDLMRPLISRFTAEEGRQELEAHKAGRDIQAAVKVAVFIRLMAGGSFWDLAIAFNIGMSTVHKIFAICLVAADNVLKLQDFPDASDIEGFKDIAIGFATSRKMVNPLPGCIGALDGICIAIEKPRRELNPLKYFCRKGFFSVPVQAVVDHCYRFVAVSIICAGATHDNLCLKVSNIGEYIRNGVSPLGFWIGGDDAYKPFERLLTPICRLVANAVQDAFNYFQSSHRVHVEQAFGFLKNKWGILWRPLKFNLARANWKIKVAMKLQNYSINNDSTFPRAKKPQESVAQAKKELDEWLLWYTEDVDRHAWVDYSVPGEEEDPGYSESIKSRRLLVELIKRKGVRRPSVAEMVERHMQGRKQSILEVEETYEI